MVYATLLFVMGAATFLGQRHGADYAAARIYGAPWFVALWTLLAAGGVVALAVARDLRRRFTLWLLHAAFVVILAGAALSRFTGCEGTLHLREGDAATSFTDNAGRQMRLPFALRLDSFCVRYYTATDAPSDFVSYVSHDGTRAEVSMNRILSLGGYRFFQKSFDPDKRGTTLGVDRDPWGIGVTYAGYLLLLAAILGRFAVMARRGMAAKRAALLGLLLMPCAANAREIPTISAEKAERAARMQVVFNRRVAPFDTPARDVLRRVYGSDTYKGLTAVQVAVGWMQRPDVWKGEPMLRVKDAALRRRLSMQGKYISLDALFSDDGHYRLADMPDSKAVRDLDEAVGALVMLTEGKLVQPLDGAAGVPAAARRSDFSIGAELLYNRLPLSRTLFMADLALGLLLLALALFRPVRRETSVPGTLRRPRFLRRARAWRGIVLGALFLLHLVPWLLRWYVGGHVPMGNGSETMQFLALCALAFALAACLADARKRRTTDVARPRTAPAGADVTLLAGGFSLLVAGFAMLVSHLGEATPQLTPLMPVLASPLLSLHVSVVMLSYALLCLTFLGSAAVLLAPCRMAAAGGLARRLLEPAVLLLAVGIFLGAVWANVSWGRYWSWDPKEVWALITLMVYALPLHARSLPWFRRPRRLHAYLLLAFLALLMTYFGVNYFLGGLHSYA